MISDGTLDLAVARGIISPDQAAELRGLETLTSDDLFTIDAVAETPIDRDDEEIRLVGSFGDIFVTLGLALVLAPLAYVVNGTFGPLPMWLSLGAASWALAEVFTRRRRLALPSLVLLGVFVVSAFFACLSLAAFLLADPHPPTTQPSWRFLPAFNTVTTGLAALLTLGLIVAALVAFPRAGDDRGGRRHAQPRRLQLRRPPCRRHAACRHAAAARLRSSRVRARHAFRSVRSASGHKTGGHRLSGCIFSPRR